MMVAVALSALLAVLAGAAVASAAEPRGDDDGDGIQNRFDPFAVDARNGLDRAPAVSLSFGGPAGGINGYGFTGLMTNGIEAYTSQFDPANAVVEGGRLSIKSVPQEDAVNNNQKYGFQLGINANPAQTGCFTVHGRVARPFDGVSPQDLQSMGIFLGTGDQDNYAKVVTTGGYKIGIEAFGEIAKAQYHLMYNEKLPGPERADLYLRVNPATGSVQAAYSLTRNGVTTQPAALGEPRLVPTEWFANPASGLAVGVLGTSYSGDKVVPGNPFPANFDHFEVTQSCLANLLPPAQGPGGSGSNSPSGANDRTPPTVSGVKMVPRRIRTTGPKKRRGGQVQFAVSERAAVRVTFAKGRTGRRVSGSCLRPTAGNRSARRCVRYLPVAGALSRKSVASGTSRIRFKGQLAGRRLRTGRYRVLVTATDGVGNRSLERSANFRVVR